MNDQRKTKARLIQELQQYRTQVAELQLSEQTLQESGERYNNLVDQASDSILVCDPQGKLTYSNETALNMLGYSREELMRLNLKDIVTADDQAETPIRLDRLDIEEVVVIDRMLRRKDGSVVPVETSAKMLPDGSLQGIFRDITERKRAEEALRLSEEKLRSIIQTAGSIIMVLSPEYKILEWNEEAERIYGRSRDEVMSEDYLRLFIPPEYREHIEEDINKVLKGEPTVRFENPIISKDGTEYQVLWNVSRLLDGEATPTGIVAIGQDITVRKQAEEELHKNEVLFRTSVETMLNCFGIYSAVRDAEGDISDFRIEYVNEAACLSNQMTKEEQIGNFLCELLPAHRETGLFDDYCRVVESGEHLNKESLIYEDVYEGRRLQKAFDIRAVKLEDGFASSWRDVTERKRAEEEREILLHDKGELVKELQCMYAVTESIRTRNTLEEIFQDVAEFIPPGWHYPEITRGKVIYDEKEYVSEPFEETRWKQSSDIIVNGDPRGSIEVYYLEECPELDEGPFMTEERNLINGMAKNISEAIELKQTAEALHESEEQLRVIYEQSPIAIEVFDSNGLLVEVNQACLDLFGVDRDAEVKGFKLFEDPNISEDTKKQLQKGAAVRYESAFDFDLVKKLGLYKTSKSGKCFIDALITPLIAENGNKNGGYLVQVLDITKRKQAEETLQESEKRYRNLHESITDHVFVLDRKFRYVMVNEAAIKVIGLPEQKIIGTDILNLFKGFETTKFFKVYKRVMASRQSEIVTDGFTHEDGSQMWYEVKVDPTPEGILCIARDITERKRVEEALEESMKTLAKAQKIAHLGSWSWSLETDQVTWSDELYRIYGFDPDKPPDALTTKFIHKKTHPDDIDRVQKNAQLALDEGNPIPIEYRILRPDKTVRTVYAVGEMELNKSGKPIKVIGTVQDITESRRAERELEESRDQLRSLSAHLQSVIEEEKAEIAREIHDELWRNLTVLKMDLAWQENELRNDQKLLQEESAAMTELTDSMIQTVKKMFIQLRPPLLDHLGVVAAIEWETGKFEERTGIGCNLTVDPEEIDLDPDRATDVYRIFKESLTNIDRHAQATAVKVSLKVDSGRLVMDISDNGIGITEEQIASPKSFGLISIRERVLQWGGETIITGDMGEGTTIAVIIPLDNGASHDD